MALFMKRTWQPKETQRHLIVLLGQIRVCAFVFLALALGLLVAVQLPLSYTVDVGVEEGYGGDLPLLWGFNTAEDDDHGTYRWTADGAAIVLPGLGQRAVLVQLDVIPISRQVASVAPDTTLISIGGTQSVVLPTYEAGRRYTMFIPPSLMRSGVLALHIHTDTFTPPDDPRMLGVPLDGVKVYSVKQPSALALPDLGAMSMWLLTLGVFWGMLLIALWRTHAHGWVPWFISGAALLIALASILDPPRWGYGASPALQAVLLSCALVIVLRLALPWLFRRMGIACTMPTLGWLLLIVGVAFGLRMGGRLYPLSMWGDIGFHTNRFIDTFGLGRVFLLSRNRGITFPYPPGGYFTLAPLILLGIDIRFVLPCVAALLDALSAVFMYVTVVAGLGSKPGQRIGLIAAALYVFTAAGFMLTWWSFDTHIYSQGATLVLIMAAMVLGDDRYDARYRTHKTQDEHKGQAALLFVLACGVFFGHFGFFMNVALLGGLLLLIVWVVAWRGNVWAQSIRWPCTIAATGAVVTALALFYSAYLWLFQSQFAAMLNGGLTNVAGRAPVSRAYLWEVLWQAGLVEHYGFFPLLLVPVGMWVLVRGAGVGQVVRWRGRSVLVVLMGCSLLVSSVFAILPFITLSTQSTRWLTFSAWAVATGAALAFRVLWRCGRAGRLAVVAMGGFVLWNTATFYLGPMLWRIRPPEPF